MYDKITLAKIAEGWCCVAEAALAACKDAAQRGVYVPETMHDLNDAVENLQIAFEWLPTWVKTEKREEHDEI